MSPTQTPPSDPVDIKTVSAPTETVREEDKIMLVLAYLGILALIPLLTVKDSPYVQWHAKNGLVLGIGGGIAVSVLSGIFAPIACLAFPALLVVDVVAMAKSLQGQRWRIPGVSDLAEKF